MFLMVGCPDIKPGTIVILFNNSVFINDSLYFGHTQEPQQYPLFPGKEISENLVKGHACS